MMDLVAKKTQVALMLERICQTLELSQTQYATAKSRYEAVGQWLSEAHDLALRASLIYPQGSISIGTTVKPLKSEEFDVDLVCLVPMIPAHTPPSALKKIIGDRLSSNGRYTDILEEKPRCWRINYANEFHLDITPSIPNAVCANGGELVPDRKLREWKSSNPRGFRRWFEERAAIVPSVRILEFSFMEARAEVEIFPESAQSKGLLKRAVQIIKRHRDMWFSADGRGVAPISVIITTLAAKSYAYCAVNFTYDTEFDLLVDVVKYMPMFIEKRVIDGREQYFVWNETTEGENFAEKWNQDVRLAQAFFSWQTQAINDIEKLLSLTGLDQVRGALSPMFGDTIVSNVMRDATESINLARNANILGISPIAGLSITSSDRVIVPSNTFFGR